MDVGDEIEKVQQRIAVLTGQDLSAIRTVDELKQRQNAIIEALRRSD
jgi:hypothetical protein